MIEITPQLLPPVSVRAVNPDGSVLVQPSALQKVVVQPAKPVVAVTVAYGSAPAGNDLTTTDDLPEGATNLYFTNARAQAALLASLDAKADKTGVLTAVDAVTDFKLGTSASGYNGGQVTFVGAGGSNIARVIGSFSPSAYGVLDFQALTGGSLISLATLDPAYFTSNVKFKVTDPASARLQLVSGTRTAEMRQDTGGAFYLTAGSGNIYLYGGNYAWQMLNLSTVNAAFSGVVTAGNDGAAYGAGWATSRELVTQKAAYAQLEAKLASALAGAANGIAQLDADGKVPTSQLPASVAGGLTYSGTWDASTNTPAMPTAATAGSGAYYKVSVAGTTSVDGISEWAVGDWVVSNGTTWDKIDNSETVSSVAGRVGAVVLVKGDVGLGNVDNTADLDKPVSTAQQTALDLKINSNLAGAFGLTLLGSATAAAAKGSLALVKGDVGLGNADNTSDADKPVSTAQQTALDGKASARPTIGSLSTSRSAADSDNNAHIVASGAGQTLTLGNITAGTSFSIRFTTAWSIACAGGLSKNGASPSGVTTGSVPADTLITFIHEGAGVWLAVGDIT